RVGRRSDSPHDVDLCLVSPCEFEHPKSERSDSDPSQELLQQRGPAHQTPPTSVSESLPTLSDSDGPPATEDCPSLLADGLESDEDTEQATRGVPKARDPLPAPMKDPCPIPAQPGICMVDPEALPPDQSRGLKKEPPGKVKKNPTRGSSAPSTLKTDPSRPPNLTPKGRGPSSSGDKARPSPGDKKGSWLGDSRSPGAARGTGARAPAGA
ncbi:MAP1S protein, partial [Urocolius indicus]|nr:MAP1S protein [Urocolius indicus]